MLPLKTELETRGLLYQFTDEKLFELYNAGGQKFYFGMDPTADSLHLGNFVNFMNAIHLMRRGNICIPLVGGATGMIGDPGGKDSERSFLSEEALAHNVAAIQAQVAGVMDNIASVTGENLQVAPIVNNGDFYTGMTFLRFLRDVGKYMTVNSMMTRETVKKRIEDPDKSISYTEFSYMLIQGYDFVRLYEDQGCKLQISGSDQWGNVTAGIELIRKKLEGEAYGLTCPLILDSTGRKFGKSEGNALWLDPKKTSHYQLYQYFLNVTDEDVSRFLKLFTLLTMEEIDAIVAEHSQQPQLRIGQKALAYRVVQIIRGTEAAELAQKVSEFIFSKEPLKALENIVSDDEMLKAIFQEIGGLALDTTGYARNSIQMNDGGEIIYHPIENVKEVVDGFMMTGLVESLGDAKKLITQNGLSLNEKPIAWGQKIQDIDRINDKVILLQKGKKNKRLIIKF